MIRSSLTTDWSLTDKKEHDINEYRVRYVVFISIQRCQIILYNIQWECTYNTYCFINSELWCFIRIILTTCTAGWSFIIEPYDFRYETLVLYQRYCRFPDSQIPRFQYIHGLCTYLRTGSRVCSVLVIIVRVFYFLLFNSPLK